jgi:hypothetical protein
MASTHVSMIRVGAKSASDRGRQPFSWLEAVPVGHDEPVGSVGWRCEGGREALGPAAESRSAVDERVIEVEQERHVPKPKEAAVIDVTSREAGCE